MLFGLMFALFALVFAGGWILLLVFGLIRRKQDRTLGTVLAVIGGIWGFVVVTVAVIAGYGYRQVSSLISATPFDPSTYHGKVGKIDLHYEGPGSIRARRLDTGKLWKFTASRGIAYIPVGSYSVEGISIYSVDDSEKWIASQSGIPGRTAAVSPKSNSSTLTHTGDDNPRIEIKAGKTVVLTPGLPFVAQASITHEDKDNIGLSMRVVNSRNQPVSVCNTENDKSAAFEVLSDSGKVLWQGAFHPG
jgi:hypothetical protein